MERVTRAVTVVLGVGCSAWMVGCGGSEVAGSGWTGEVLDSAGVRVVVSQGQGSWAGASPVLVEELRMGSVGGGGPDEFGDVVALDVDAAGDIYVLDQQARQVRVFDGGGSHRRTLGGPGAGPGELSAVMMGVFVSPDGTVSVPDVGNARVTRFGSDGSSYSSTPMRIDAGVPIRWDATQEGDLVAQLRQVAGATTGEEGLDLVVRYGSDGAVSDTIAAIPTGTTITTGPDGLPRIRLFEPEPIWDLSESGALVRSMNSAYRVEVYSAEGDLQHVLVRPGERRPVSQGDQAQIRRLVTETMLDQGTPPAVAERIGSEMTFADNYPVLAGVMATPGGEVWVQRVRSLDQMGEDGDASGYLDVRDLGSADWDVFDSEGRYQGTLTFPDRFTLLKIVDDRVYGVLRDDLDVQHVLRMRVSRP
jgi:hypothetical protein